MSLIYFHHYYARKGSHFREIIRRNTDLPKVLSSFLKKTILIASGWPKNPGPSTGEEVPYFWKFTFFKNSISLVENLRLKISTANLKTKPKKVKSHRGTHRNHFFLQKKIRPIRIFFVKQGFFFVGEVLGIIAKKKQNFFLVEWYSKETSVIDIIDPPDFIILMFLVKFNPSCFILNRNHN